jgi:hypothetical protein
MGRIEILNDKDELEVVYYHIPIKVRKFWNRNFIKEYRNNLIDNVKRDNPEEKVKDFFEKSERLMYAVDHQEMLHSLKHFPFIGKLLYFLITGKFKSNFVDKIFLNWFSFLITIALNLIVLLTYQVDGDEWKEVEDTSLKVVVKILGIVHLVLMIILLIYHLSNWTWLKAIITLDELTENTKRSRQT